MKEKVKYRHIRLSRGEVTIAFIMDEDWTHFKRKTHLCFGMSFCSPKEKSFNKKKGRELALERLHNPDTMMELLISGNFPVRERSLVFSSFIQLYAEKINVPWLLRKKVHISKKKEKNVAVG